MKRVCLVLVVISGFLVVCGRSNVQEEAAASSALTVDECNYFDVNGTVRICHFNGSTKKPYTILHVSSAGCVDGHSTHPNDFIPAETDLTCSGSGCFPAGAPVDSTVPCCDGLVPEDGVCVAASDGGSGDGGTSGGGTGDGGTSGGGSGDGGTGDGGTGDGGTGDGGTSGGGTSDGGTSDGGTGDGGSCPADGGGC
jgi:hypothetical protein